MGKLLVVIDYQNDFVSGALGFKKAEELENGIYKKVNEYLKSGDKVLFTYDTHYDNYLETREGKNLPVIHCILGSLGHELYGKLKDFKERENTIHLNKEAFGISPENMIKLREELKEVESIELLGIVSNICLISNVVTFQSTFINSNIKVSGELSASFDEELHTKALDVIESLGVEVSR